MSPILQLPKRSKQQNIGEDICDLSWILSKKKSNALEGKNSLSLIDLYCGCGGMSLGIEEALKLNQFSLKIALALDMDKDSLEVYKSNFEVSDEVALNIDINQLVTTRIGEPLDKIEIIIKQKYKNIDILVAGPPCQGHSNLNNHTRRNDPRNNLYLNAIRFVEIVMPKVAIIENVSTVIHDIDDVVNQGKIGLEKKGYKIHSLIIDTSKYGLAQKRKRHFQIAIFNSDIDIDLSSYLFNSQLKVADYIKDIITEHKFKSGIFYTPSKTKEINKKRIDYLFFKDLHDLPDSMRPDCHKTKSHSYKSCYGRMHWNKPAQTITSGFGSMGQGRYVHSIEKRVITPHEAARIQGFPDFFDFTKVTLRTSLHTMIANAVPPKIIAVLASYLFKNKIFKDESK